MGSQLNKSIRSYQLVERIGKGGFGEVYRAYQPTVGREVAIKVIMPRHANRPDFIRNFETEAKVVARLEHPFIVPLFDYWREPSGAYIVMRYLRGGTLKEEMAQGQMPLLRVAEILDNLCSALWTSHRNRVAHRDIKPANIMLDDERRVYLSDFGLAITIGEDHFENLVGTWLYMPPERIQEQTQTHTVDVYSLGMMAFQMLAGDYPFDRSTMQRLAQSHISEYLPPIERYRNDAPPELNMVLQRATSKDPDSRYDDIRVLAQDFRRIVQPMGTMADVTQILKVYEEIVNPYMGLRPFLEADSNYFFGRQTLINQLVERMNEDTAWANFLALIGPSGSGKSSAIYAGLIPRLKQGAVSHSRNWYYATMTPGSQPFQNLLIALRSVSAVAIEDITEQLIVNPNALIEFVPSLLGDRNSTLMLFIDQFEEVFTQVDDEATRQEFLDLLTNTITDPATHVQIIITMRADFYDKPLRYEKFGKLIQHRTEVVLPLDTSELERVITGPANQVGLDVEPELIAEIISDVKSEPGALPLLQYTLTELFNRSDGVKLTLKAYRDSGGVRGSLARRADMVYQTLSDVQKHIAHQIFLRLVTLGDGAVDTRRRARFSELWALAEEPERVQSVLDEFSQYRLLTFDRDPDTREPLVEVAHEALIREWRQFQIWLDASRDDLRLQRLIATEVADWKSNRQDTSYLLRGSRLAQFEHWAESTNLVISQDELQFIQASITEQRREEKEQYEHHLKELQLMKVSSRRLRLIVLLLIFTTIGGLILGAAIVKQNQDVQRERDNALKAEGDAIAAQKQAETNLLNAYSSTFSAKAQQAIGDGDYGLALAFALQAIRLDEESDVAYNTLFEIAYAAGVSQIIQTDNRPVYSTVLSADGGLLASIAGEEFSRIIADYLPQTEQDRLHPQVVTRPPDFSMVDFGQLSPPVIQIWDTDTGELLSEFTGHQSTITSVGFVPAPDDKTPPTLAFSADILGNVMLWDVASGQMIRQLESLPQGYNRLSMSQKGVLLGSNGMPVDTNENRLVIWDVESGKIVQRFARHTSGLWDSIIFADGGQAVSIYLNGTQVIWDTETGEQIADLLVDDEIVAPNYHIDLDANGDFFVTSTGSSEVTLWQYHNGQIRQDELAFSLDTVLGAALSGAGDRLLILQPNAKFVDWDVSNRELIELLEERGEGFVSIDVSADGNTASIGRSDGSILIWDLTDLYIDLVQEFPDLSDDVHATFMPISADSSDEQLLVFQGERTSLDLISSTLSIWDVETGELISEWKTPHTLMPAEVAVDATGQTAITLEQSDRSIPLANVDNQQLVVWDLASQDVRHEIDLDYPVSEVKYVPNSGDPLLAMTGWRNGAALWNLDAGAITYIYDSPTDIVDVNITPDQRFVFGVDATGQLMQWDFVSGDLVHTYTLGPGSHLFEIYPEKSWIATGYNRVNIAIWNYETHEQVALLEGHPDTVLSADFALAPPLPDEDDYLLLVSAGRGGNIIYWDMADFTSVATILYDSPVEIEVSNSGLYHTVVPEYGILDVLYVFPEEDNILDYIHENRIVHEITRQDCVLYGIQELCQNADVFAITEDS